MADATGGGAFATDLGYLEKFLDKLERHASAMADAPAKVRLVVLLAEERARWAELRGLLGSGAGSGERSDARPSAPKPAPGSSATPDADRRPGAPGFTVGSLVKR